MNRPLIHTAPQPFLSEDQPVTGVLCVAPSRALPQLSKPFNASKRDEMAAAMARVNAAFGKPDGLQTRDEMLDEAYRYTDLKARLGHTFKDDPGTPSFGHGWEKEDR